MEADLILKAINRICWLYNGKQRKISGSSFIVYPLSVFCILQKHTENKKTLAAALLIDALKESADYNYNHLESEFGTEVAQIVKELSENDKLSGSKKETWTKRKYEMIEKFPKMRFASQIIFVASKAYNLDALVEDYNLQGKEIWEMFNASEEKIAKYYYNTFVMLTSCFHDPLNSDYHNAYQKANQLFNWEERFLKQKKT